MGIFCGLLREELRLTWPNTTRHQWLSSSLTCYRQDINVVGLKATETGLVYRGSNTQQGRAKFDNDSAHKQTLCFVPVSYEMGQSEGNSRIPL